MKKIIGGSKKFHTFYGIWRYKNPDSLKRNNKFEAEENETWTIDLCSSNIFCK